MSKMHIEPRDRNRDLRKRLGDINRSRNADSLLYEGNKGLTVFNLQRCDQI